MGTRVVSTNAPLTYNQAAAVTPNDSTELTVWAKALWIGGAGNVKITTADGSVVTLNGALAGTVVPVTAKVVWSTGTTATNIVALW